MTSLEGTRLSVRPAPLATSVGGVKVAGLRVLRADIPATNGCIHGARARHARARGGRGLTGRAHALRAAVLENVILPEALQTKLCARPRRMRCRAAALTAWRGADARTLPGTIPTVGFWDPLGFTDGQARPLLACALLRYAAADARTHRRASTR